ncbi:hypothetical protein [Halococcus sp. IIIV-5B]|uniref:hypothetical protein n=1 Tax=Halococcus sp. IIIV-5B TaxID=2321230 RepID=UPI001314D480|nr:hypothetical protein [Halococcus sp. IIIV-5B]
MDDSKRTNGDKERVPEEPGYDVSEEQLESLRFLRDETDHDISEVARALLEVINDE